MSRSVLVVEDHPLVRAGMRALLRGLDADIDVDEASSVEDAIEHLSTRRYELALYDWHLPGPNGDPGGGMRGLVAMRETAPHTPVLVVSADSDEAVRFTALHMGASGYLSKAAGEEQIARAIAGLLYAAAPVTAPSTLLPQRDNAAQAARGPDLTARQRDVLRLMAHGQPNKGIARSLGIAEPTVRAHVTGLLKVLKAKNRTEAVIKAAELGLNGRHP